MWWLLIDESYTPEDDKTIEMVLNGADDGVKYTPTSGFLKQAYSELNSRLFGGKLPNSNSMDLSIRTNIDDSCYIGCSNIVKHTNGDIDVDGIWLDGTIMLTLHDWMCIIIHEMIHIQEVIEHPEHLYEDNYNGHGRWFMNRASEFEKYGFVITSKFNGNFDVSIDSDTIRNQYNKEVLIQIDSNSSGSPQVIKVLGDDLESILRELKEREYETVKILKTSNFNSVKMRLTNVGTDEDLYVYTLSGKLKGLLEPIDVVETIDLNDIVLEGSSIQQKSDDIIVTSVDDDGSEHLRIY